MLDIWRETVKVRFGDVDRSDRLTLAAVFSLFQEASISHATDLGVGRFALAQAGQAWVLSRLSLAVERRPASMETLVVSSWPRGCDRLFALRDYEIRDSKDEALVRGRGGWLILDIAKRRPVRVEPIVESLPLNEGIDAFPAGPAALKQADGLAKSSERRALYSDIDYFGHVNNARYIQWIQDATDPELLAKADKFRLDINYLSEILPGETIELWTAALAEPGIAYEGRRPGSEQAVFRAELRMS